jgi:trk system potassium uptake protein TrkA
VSASLGIPAARHTDVFADGQVQVVEFDVPADAARNAVIGRSLRQAEIPPNSNVAGLIRGERMVVPSGEERIRAGDRVVVIGSPDAARAWSRMVSRDQERVDDAVIFGAGRMGTTIASVLLERGIRVRVVDSVRDRVAEIAETLPGVRAFHAEAFDPEFLEHERIGRAPAACSASTTTRRTSTARCSRRATASA